MADVVISVDFQEEADAFNRIQRELRQTGMTGVRSLESIETQSNELRRANISLRGEVQQLGAAISSNNRIASQADQPTRTRLAASNRQIRVEQSLLRTQMQRNSVVLAGLGQEQRELRQVTAATNRLMNANEGATRSTRGFSGAAGGLRNVLGALGVAAIGQQVVQFGRNAIEASARLEGFERGLRLVEGTNAPERLEELIQVANLPGLNLDSLINYSNRLRAIGLTADETDAILENTGKTIVAFGGTADTAAQAVEQIVQAISTNTVSLQDFRSIAQRIPGFYQQIAETHGVAASIDGFRVAVDNASGSVKDALIPVLEALGEEFGQVPAESYVVSLDGLQNAFFLLQAEIGDQFLPIIAEAARGLSEFFDAIRTNDLDDLPEPIRQIVEGAQSLYQGFINVAESIRRGLGPEVDLLLPAIGSLLGSILDLAGSLITALAPAYEVLAVPTRIAIALIVNLAETISTVIVAITDFVDWVSGAAAAEDMLAASTERATSTVDGLTEATKRATAEAQRKAEMTRNATAAEEDATTAGDNAARQLAITQGALLNVNQELREKRARLETLAETITSKAHPAYVQLERQVKVLEGSSADLSAQVSTLSAEITQVEAPTNTATQAAARLTSGTNELRVAIAALPTEFTAVRVDIQRLTPFTEAINQQFQDMELSLVDTTAETQVFNQIFRELQTALTSFAADQAIANAEIELVNPAISDAVESMRTYIGELEDVEGGLEDVETISENVRESLRNQGSDFDDLREKVDTAEVSLDDLDTTFNRIPSTVDDIEHSFEGLGIGFETLQDVALTAVDEIIEAFSDLDGEIDTVGEALGSVSDLITRIASGDLTAIVQAPFRILEIIDQQNAAAAERREDRRVEQESADTVRTTQITNLDAIARVFGIDLGQLDPSEAFHDDTGLITATDFLSNDIFDDLFTNLLSGDFGLRGGFGENIQEIVDAVFGDLDDVFDPTQQESIASQITGLVVNLDRFIQGADIQDIFQPFINSFRNAMERAGDNFSEAIDDGASAEDIEENFQAYIRSVNAVFDAQIESARAQERATGVLQTDTIRALESSRASALNTARTRTANAGVSTTTPTGSRSTPGETSPLSEAYAAAVEEGQEAVEELADFFSFGRDQRDVLAPLEAAVNTAQDALDFIEEDLNATSDDRIAAYTALTNAEQALYDQQVSFVENATDITDDVRTRVLSVLQSNFNQEIREANDDLVDSLEEIGAELVNVLAFTSGILTGSALAVRQIPLDLAPITDADFTPQDPVTPIERQTGGIEDSVIEGPEPTSTALLRNAVERSQFELRGATSEDDFESRRGTLTNAINEFYDAELDRIAEVAESEEELQDLREDNILARERALDRAGNRTNTFAEARIKAEEQVAEAAQKAAEDAAQAKIKADEAAAEAAMELAEEESEARREAYEAALEAQIQAAEELQRAQREAAQAASTAARNTLNRSQFNLRGSGSEGGFESNRQELITAINEFYDLELARIAEVAESEIELDNLRDASQLNREQALRRATTATNAFAEARIDEEERVAEAAIEAAEDAAEAKREADEDAAEAAIELAEEESEARREAYEAALEAQAEAAAEAERLQREAAEAASTAARNTLNRSQFNLRGSGSESDFESNRQTVIANINTFYDLELARIAEVAESEIELNNLRDASALARDQALRRAINSTNTFTEARIAEEERVAEAAMEAAQAKIEADAEAAEAAMRLAEEVSEANQQALDEALAAQREATETAVTTASAFARNTLNRSQFELGGATGEDDFESRRGTLITSINEFYDAELARITEVAESEDQLRILRDASELSREQALQRATTATNTFAEDRIKSEEQVAEAAIKASEEQIAEIEKQAEAEREAAADAVEAAREAAEEIAEAAMELARDRFEIQRELGRDLVEIETELARDIEEIQRDLAREIEDINRDLGRRLTAIQNETSRAIYDIGVELARDERDIATDLARDLRGIEADKLQSIEDLNTEHTARLAEIHRESARDQVDINTDLARRIEDINRNAQREIEELQDDSRLGPRTNARVRRESIEAIQTQRDQRIADAELRANRERGDTALGQRRAEDDLGVDTEADREALQNRAIAEQEAARLAASQDIEDERQESRDDEIDTRQEQRDDEIDVREDARQDVVDERSDARHETDQANLEARQENEDAYQDAADADADAHQQSLFDLQDLHQQSGFDAMLLHIEASQGLIDAYLAQRIENEAIASETLQASINTQQTIRTNELLMVAAQIDNSVSGLSGASEIFSEASELLISTIEQARLLGSTRNPRADALLTPQSTTPALDGSSAEPTQLNASLIIQFPDGATQELGNQMVRLEDQRRLAR